MITAVLNVVQCNKFKGIQNLFIYWCLKLVQLNCIANGKDGLLLLIKLLSRVNKFSEWCVVVEIKFDKIKACTLLRAGC